MTRYDQIQKAIDNYEKMVKSYGNQLIGVYKGPEDISNADPRSVYSHIRHLYNHIKALKEIALEYNDASKNVLTAWDTLNKRLKNDPHVKEQWESILIVMKLME